VDLFPTERPSTPNARPPDHFSDAALRPMKDAHRQPDQAGEDCVGDPAPPPSFVTRRAKVRLADLVPGEVPNAAICTRADKAYSFGYGL